MSVTQDQILEAWQDFDADAYDNPIDRAQAFQEKLHELPDMEPLGLDEVASMMSRLPDSKDIQMNLEELGDPEKLKQKIDENIPQVRDDPKMLAALKKKGVSPEEFERIAKDPRFQAGLGDMSQQLNQRLTHNLPPCHLCGKKSKMSKSHQGLPFCSDKCRKSYLKK